MAVLTKREQILRALHMVLAETGMNVQRNGTLPDNLPSRPLVIFRDGSPGEPESIVSPLTYFWTHKAEVEIVVSDETDCDAAMDKAVRLLGEAIASDRTLGGLCDWVEAQGLEPVEMPPEVSSIIKAATFIVELQYATADALA